MAEKTLTMTLMLKVSDLSDAERAKEANDMMCTVDEVPMLDEVTPGDITSGIEAVLKDNDVVQEYIWAGSECFAKITSVDIVGAKWEE